MIEHKNIRDAKIDGYLTGLGWALAGADPVERSETLASIREHLEEALPSDATSEQVDQAISALGPASAIAAEATPGYRPTIVVNQVKETDWSAVMILAGGIASLFLIPLIPFALILAVVILIAGIMKLRSKGGSRAFVKGGIAAASLTLVLMLIMLLGVFSFMTISDTETETIEVTYPQDE